MGVIKIVFCWIIFADYGEEGWHSLIPIYGDYILFTIACSPMFFVFYIASAVLLVITYVKGMTLLAVICCAIMLVCLTIPLVAIFQDSYKKSTRISAIGMFVLQVVIGGGQMLVEFFG